MQLFFHLKTHVIMLMTGIYEGYIISVFSLKKHTNTHFPLNDLASTGDAYLIKYFNVISLYFHQAICLSRHNVSGTKQALCNLCDNLLKW